MKIPTQNSSLLIMIFNLIIQFSEIMTKKSICAEVSCSRMNNFNLNLRSIKSNSKLISSSSLNIDYSFLRFPTFLILEFRSSFWILYSKFINPLSYFYKKFKKTRKIHKYRPICQVNFLLKGRNYSPSTISTPSRSRKPPALIRFVNPFCSKRITSPARRPERQYT